LIRTQNRETFNINKEKYVTISLEMKRTLLPFLTALLLVSCPGPNPTCGFDACRITIDLSKQDITLEQGASETLTITPTSDNGYSGNIEIKLSDLPNGVSYTLEPKTVLVGGTPAKSVLKLTADPSALVGMTPEVTVIPVGQNVNTQKKTFKLTVKAKPVTPPAPPPVTPPAPTPPPVTPPTPPSPPPPPPPPPVTEVTVSPTNVNACDTMPITFTAKLLPSGSFGTLEWTTEPNANDGTFDTTASLTVKYTPPPAGAPLPGSSRSITLRAKVKETGASSTASVTIGSSLCVQPPRAITPPT
jgi:hypothetical protein